MYLSGHQVIIFLIPATLYVYPDKKGSDFEKLPPLKHPIKEEL
jgi:hypothetical protein